MRLYPSIFTSVVPNLRGFVNRLGICICRKRLTTCASNRYSNNACKAGGCLTYIRHLDPMCRPTTGNGQFSSKDTPSDFWKSF